MKREFMFTLVTVYNIIIIASETSKQRALVQFFWELGGREERIEFTFTVLCEINNSVDLCFVAL